MASSTGNLTNHNDCTAEQMGTEQCDLSAKTPQIGSECLDSDKGLLGDVLTSSVIDEKSNQVSANMTDNSVIQLPDTHHSVENSRRTLEGSCLQQSTDEQVPVNISDDKPENRSPQNLPNELGEISNAISDLAVEDQMQSVPSQVNLNSVYELLDPISGDVAESLQKEPGELSDALTGLVVEDQMQSIPVLVNTSPANEPLDSTSGDVAKSLQNEPGEVGVALTGVVIEDQTQSFLQVNTSPANELLDPASGDVSKNLQNEPGELIEAVTSLVVEEQAQSVPAQVNMGTVNELLDPPSEDVAKNISSDCSERNSKSSAHLHLKHKGKSNSKIVKKYILRSFGSSDRTLRSRTRDKSKPPEPNNNVVDVSNDRMKTKSGKKKKKKKKKRDEGINDQFSKIRAQLRYLLNRASYEQSLIDAYSGEGWKGYSVEKLKPEKEIQRAKSEILRRKLKIRDLFQNLDSLCAEGRLPDSLFDSKGEIDSEDIFCAKCQSKESSLNNDIILCDGACDRGFHQLCLDPPLLTEDIPGDEGWLCPGCDCKDDCIDLVNDFSGTSLLLTDTWERVFPEAAKVAGGNLNHNLELPSDDSDDDDFNPNAPEDVEVEGGESSSDASDYASASEKLEDSASEKSEDSASEKSEDSRHEDQYMGLPSEDSEDDDFDPNAPVLDNKGTEESSSSDFTSDSEDLENFKDSSKQKSDVGNRPSIADEVSSLLEPDLGQEDLTPVSGKRNVERLDYKKLYEETYHSDTSDDEDWTATTASRKKKLAGKMTPVPPNGSASNNSRHTPRRSTHQSIVENTNNSPTKSLEGCEESGSRNRKRRPSTYKRLGEAVVQRLHKSFKENQFPNRVTKESLAQELGLTFQQVDKWFGNSRWSFRHSSGKETSPGSNALQQATDSRAENKGEGEFESVSHEISEEKSRTLSSRKRKILSEPQASEAGLVSEGSPAACSPRADEMKVGNKMKRRKRK